MTDLAADLPADPSSLARELFEAHETALVGERDFSLFRRLAITYLAVGLAPGSTAERPGSEAFFAQTLFELLERVTQALGAGEAVAAAIEAYVAEVAPRALAAKVSPGDIGRLARESGVTRHLSGSTIQTLINLPDWDPTRPAPPAAIETPEPPAAANAEPAEPVQDQTPALVMLTRTAESQTPPDEPAASEYATQAPGPEDFGQVETQPGDDPIAEVDYEAILRSCLHARRRGRKVLVVVGLAATGKSFFVARLKRSLARTYDVACQKGLPKTGEQEIDRTKAVLHYLFDRIGQPKSKANLDIYDIPGDQFVKLLRTGFVATQDRETVRLLYAILTFADGIVFIAPALQVLMQDTFARDGDDLDLKADEIRARLADIQTFISGLPWLTRAMNLLQEDFGQAYRTLRRNKTPKDEARKAAADTAVEALLALNFDGLRRRMPKADRLALPALLLLSRADELRTRLPTGRDTFDADPAYQLLLRNRAHLDGLAGRFDTFSVDFLTAVEGHRFGRNFDPDNPSFGCGGLIEDWFLPAIRHSRGDPVSRWLRNPRIALRLRRWLDPAFNDAWEREGPVRG